MSTYGSFDISPRGIVKSDAQNYEALFKDHEALKVRYYNACIKIAALKANVAILEADVEHLRLNNDFLESLIVINAVTRGEPVDVPSLDCRIVTKISSGDTK